MHVWFRYNINRNDILKIMFLMQCNRWECLSVDIFIFVSCVLYMDIIYSIADVTTAGNNNKRKPYTYFACTAKLEYGVHRHIINSFYPMLRYVFDIHTLLRSYIRRCSPIHLLYWVRQQYQPAQRLRVCKCDKKCCCRTFYMLKCDASTWNLIYVPIHSRSCLSVSQVGNSIVIYSSCNFFLFRLLFFFSSHSRSICRLGYCFNWIRILALLNG